MAKELKRIDNWLKVSYGYGLKSFKGEKIYLIDGIQTVIDGLKGNIAFGFAINDNLTERKIFIAKVGNFFAHGKTVKDAVRDANAKFLNNMPI